jgi:hypothetical protein
MAGEWRRQVPSLNRSICIAAKRRNKSNPWFNRGTLFKSAVDVLRRAQAPMVAKGAIADLCSQK